MYLLLVIRTCRRNWKTLVIMGIALFIMYNLSESIENMLLGSDEGVWEREQGPHPLLPGDPAHQDPTQRDHREGAFEDNGQQGVKNVKYKGQHIVTSDQHKVNKDKRGKKTQQAAVDRGQQHNKPLQHDDAASNDTSLFRMCEKEERITHLKHYCEKHPNLLREAETSKLRRILNEAMLVDDVNKVIVCLHAKVACSTWKWTLVNNTIEYPLPQNPTHLKDIHNDIWKYGLRRVGHEKYSDEDIRYRLDNYYKIMVVRNPYDRLLSLYEEKFARTNAEWRNMVGKHVMELYHPDLHDNWDTISFPDLIHYMQDGHRDVHWEGPYHKLCAPCAVNYDYIVKLETHERDHRYVIEQHLKGRGAGMHANKAQGSSQSSRSKKGKYMKQFANVTTSQLKFLKERFTPDLDMFGYQFNDERLEAKCSYDDDDECC